MSFEQNPSVNEGPYALSGSASFALDLIRTIAAQAVLVGHAISVLGLLPGLQPPHFAYMQNVAVVVFFLLSGLLISYSVFSRPQRPTFTSYFIDRFARIYAGLVPALIFIFLVDWIIISRGWEYEFGAGYSILDFVGNALMLQDYPVIGPALGITSFGSGRVLWTLAVEWWLYMAFGWWVLGGRQGTRFWVVALLLLPVPLYNAIAGRGDGLTVMWLIGVACCLLLRGRHLRFAALGRGSLVCALLAVAAGGRLWVTKDAYDLLFAVLAAGWLVTLIALLDHTRPRVPDWLFRAVKFAADYSFTLYLVHLSVIAIGLQAIGDMSPWGTFALLFFAANVAAALLALGTEMQHHRIRRYLKRRFVRPVSVEQGSAL
jgi:peptidoglycan/LPS O-acetylase OafA/YrhL